MEHRKFCKFGENIKFKLLFCGNFFGKVTRTFKTIAKKGHELGLLNKYSYQKEIETAKDFLEELTGKTIRGMRQFPEKKAEF